MKLLHGDPEGFELDQVAQRGATEEFAVGLQPGEFLGSGTVGNGCGLELDRWIKPGDVIELEIAGLGRLRNKVVQQG